jgi:5-formyltetrahydrofolate cyclo-ligase
MAGAVRGISKSEKMISALEQKKELRKETRQRLQGISAAQRKDFSEAAVRQLLQRPEWQEVKTVLAYLPLSDELDLRSALQSAAQGGKMVALPRFMPDESKYCAALVEDQFAKLIPGSFGIPEPPLEAECIPLNRLDFVLVPGVAFGLNGYRLGRGKGFYDRLLAEVTGVKCGVALDEQIIRELPVESHDIPMNFILTPTRWLSISAAAHS